MSAVVLRVMLFGRLLGSLQISAGGDPEIPEDWCFSYALEYLAAGGPPLSVALPLRTQSWLGAVVYNWFDNLLPEGNVRAAYVRRLRLPADDSFALLTAIGGECAGAVSIVPEHQQDLQHPADPSELGASLDRLRPDDAGEGSWALLGGPLRLSLAGAQDKLAVVRVETGLRLPMAGEASTHILKPDSLRLPGTRDLEALGMRLAQALELPVPDVELLRLGKRPALLIKRFDRLADSSGAIQRLHQEDFCQALGLPSALKYQAGGGPSLARCAELIRNQLRLGPAALTAFLDWVIYAVLLGNADAHGKNLALLRAAEGKLGLAPFYDLVPTICWSEHLLDRQLAMRIGDADRIDQLSAEHWRQFALACGYGPSFVLRRLQSLADRALRQLPRVAEQLVLQGADAQRLSQAQSLIATQIRHASI